MTYKGLTAGRGVVDSVGEERIRGGPRYEISMSGGQVCSTHRNADVARPVDRSSYSANLVKPLQGVLNGQNYATWYPICPCGSWQEGQEDLVYY